MQFLFPTMAQVFKIQAYLYFSNQLFIWSLNFTGRGEQTDGCSCKFESQQILGRFLLCFPDPLIANQCFQNSWVFDGSFETRGFSPYAFCTLELLPHDFQNTITTTDSLEASLILELETLRRNSEIPKLNDSSRLKSHNNLGSWRHWREISWVSKEANNCCILMLLARQALWATTTILSSWKY